MKKPLHQFILGVVIWFPITFFIWFITAKFHLAPIAWLTDQLFSFWMPEAVMWIKLDHHTLVLASNFGENAVGQITSPPTGENILGFHTNPLIYSYGLPLLYSLILATPDKNKWLKMIWGTFFIIPTELFSMVFSVLKTLTFDVGSAFQQQQLLNQFDIDSIAIAYQAGSLIIPMVTPLIIWVAMHREFLERLAPQIASRLGSNARKVSNSLP